MPNGTHIAIIIVGIVAIGAGVETQRRTSSRASPPPQAGAISNGYLPHHFGLDDFDLQPPSSGSPAMQRDEQARRSALQLQGTARYELAEADSLRTHPQTVQAFSCALGTEISRERTPKLYHLLAGVRLGARSNAYSLKHRYNRLRPFVAKNARGCPGDSELQASGSYPSAGSAVGWAYALVLAELNPARSDAIIKRGFDYGQSRLICDAEWQSDVDAGRRVATETVRQMHANKAFRADLNAARKEVASAMAMGHRPPASCALEARALASRANAGAVGSAGGHQ